MKLGVKICRGVVMQAQQYWSFVSPALPRTRHHHQIHRPKSMPSSAPSLGLARTVRPPTLLRSQLSAGVSSAWPSPELRGDWVWHKPFGLRHSIYGLWAFMHSHSSNVSGPPIAAGGGRGLRGSYPRGSGQSEAMKPPAQGR